MCTCSTTTDTVRTAAVTGARFKVEDMTCAHCVGTIRKALGAGMPGVGVSVDLDTHEVVVAGDADVAAAIMRDAGYEPMLVAG
jgi:copper chaperone